MRHDLLLGSALLLAGLVHGGAVTESPAEPIPSTGENPEALGPLDAAVRETLETTGIPGAAIAVSRDGHLVLARGYGYADRETETLVEPDSRFRIASVTKPITSVAVLTLIQQGRLSLDTRLLDVLELRPPAGHRLDPRLGEVTIRDLLYHAGGWDRAKTGFDPMFSADRIAVAMGERPPATADVIVRFMLGEKLDFRPGTRQAYSNFGYAVLGRVIEAVAGSRYEDYVQKEIFAPAEAHRVVMGRSLLEHRASGEVRYHDPRRAPSIIPGLGMVPAPYGGFSIEAMDAHGGWVASAPDLLRFLEVVDEILDEKTLRLMTSPHESADAQEPYLAMGWYVIPDGEREVWYHQGDLPGTTALLARTDTFHLALLMNGTAPDRESVENILPRILEAARSTETWPKRDLWSNPKGG